LHVDSHIPASIPIILFALRHGKADASYGGRPLDSGYLLYYSSCEKKKTCSGECNQLLITQTKHSFGFRAAELEGQDSLFYEPGYANTVDIDEIPVISEYDYYSKGVKDILEHLADAQFRVNHEALIKNAAGQIVLRRFCDKIDPEATLNYLKKLPAEVTICFQNESHKQQVIAECRNPTDDARKKDVAFINKQAEKDDCDILWDYQVYKKTKWVAYNKVVISPASDHIALVHDKSHLSLLDFKSNIVWTANIASPIIHLCFNVNNEIMILTPQAIVLRDLSGRCLGEQDISSVVLPFGSAERHFMNSLRIAFCWYPHISIFNHNLQPVWHYPRKQQKERVIRLKGYKAGDNFGHGGSIMCASFNSSNMIAIGTNCGELAVYDPDGSIIYFAGYCSATDEYIFSADDYWEAHSKHGDPRVRNVFLSEGNVVAAVIDRSLILFSIDTGLLWRTEFPGKSIENIYLSHDGRYCAFTVENVWFLVSEEGHLVQTIEAKAPICHFALSLQIDQVFLYDTHLTCYSLGGK